CGRCGGGTVQLCCGRQHRRNERPVSWHHDRARWRATHFFGTLERAERPTDAAAMPPFVRACYDAFFAALSRFQLDWRYAPTDRAASLSQLARTTRHA